MYLLYELLITLFGILTFILLCCWYNKYRIIALKNHNNNNRIVPTWIISPQVLKINYNNEKHDISTVSTIIEFPDKNRLHEVALVTI